MKIKFLPVLAMLSVMVLFSCEKNPQKEAQKTADVENKKADQQEDQASKNLSKGVDHANQAVEHRTMAELNEAFASVDLPEFDNMAASEMAKKIGNDAKAFINSDNYQETGKYVDQINADLQELADKVSKGSITEAEADQITTYANNLASAVGLQL